MSLEEKIEKLSSAVEALTVQISALVNDANFGKIAAPSAGVNGSAGNVEPEEKPAPKKSRSKPAETKPAPVVDPLEESPADDFDLGLDEEAAPAEEAVTLDQVKAKCSEIAKTKGRETILKLFKQFDAATFGDIKPEQYAKLYKAACAV